ncbi:MAG: response regulator transcription factor [Burkholderiales bacterium]|nr:response regulator transcription factor [Burkholderiales bacterium]
MPDEKKYRILIIDDDVGFRDLLRLHLKAAGYEVQVAEDGVTGGRALLEQTPDLVVSDLNMPYLDGFELLRLLHSDAETASIPVILLSGRSDSDTMAKAVELGASDYLSKPVTRDQLLESIEACLRRSKGRTQSPDYGSTPAV